MYLDQIMVLCSLKRRVRKVTKVLSVDDLSKAVKLDWKCWEDFEIVKKIGNAFWRARKYFAFFYSLWAEIISILPKNEKNKYWSQK